MSYGLYMWRAILGENGVAEKYELEFCCGIS